MKSNKPLTSRQQAILDYIREFQRLKNYPPTIRQIGATFRIHSTNGVHCNLVALERKGKIKRAPNASRAIEVLDKSNRGIPLLRLSDLRR